MSELLDEVIRLRKNQTLEYKEYLDKIIDLAKRSKDGGQSTEYPEGIKTKGQKALFDNLGEDEDLAEKLDHRIKEVRPHGWRGNRLKTRKVEYAVKEVLGNDEEKLKEIMEIINEHKGEY
jgi:type I restriction enzyme R subunit